MYKSECCDRQNEIKRLRAALSAVKSWDIGNALGVLSASGEARFALPENIRKQVQDALGHNGKLQPRTEAGESLPE